MINKTVMNPYEGTGFLYANALDFILRKIDGKSVLESVMRLFQPQPEITCPYILELASQYHQKVSNCEDAFFDPTREQFHPDVIKSFNFSLRLEEFMQTYHLSQLQTEQIQSILNVIKSAEETQFFCEAEEMRTKIAAFETLFILSETKPNHASAPLTATAVFKDALDYWEKASVYPMHPWNDFIRSKGLNPEKINWKPVLEAAVKGALTGTVIMGTSEGGAAVAAAASVVELIDQVK